MWSRGLVFKYFLVALFLGAFGILLLPFFSELLLAGVFALAIEPMMGRWFQPRHARWKFSVAGILLLMFTLIAVPACFVAYRTYRYFFKLAQSGVQNSEIYQRVLELKSRAIAIFERLTAGSDYLAALDINGLMDEGVNQLLNSVVQVSTSLAGRIPNLLISIFVFCAALYYFLAESRQIKSVLLKQRLFLPAEANRFIGILQKSSYGTVVTSIVIAAIQASIVTVGSLIFKTGDPPVVWAVTFFFSFIPVIGAGPVALALGLSNALMGDYGSALGFLVVAIIAGTTDNLLRPYMISSNEQDLNPVVSLLAIIGAILVFGMPGLFLGPVISTVAIKIVPTLFESEEVPRKKPESARPPS